MKKRYITLLEVLIALSILAIVGSLAAYNIRKLYQEQQALDEMNRVVHLLNTATDLMMLVHLDSEVRFSKKSGHFEVTLLPKSSVSPLIQPLISKGPHILEHIDHVAFKDGILDTELNDNFSLFFLSKGFLMNRGVLTLQRHPAIGSILLYGYPAPLSLSKGVVAYPDEKTFQDMIQKVAEQTGLET